MPVTARLSRKFYERFGDDVAGELVDLLNTMDASYRAEYRELLDARLAQFAAELRQVVGELRAGLRSEMASLDSGLRAEMAMLNAGLRSEMTGLRAEVNAELGLLRAEVTVRLKSQETRLLRWMIGLWITSMLALAGTLAVR